MAPIVITPGEPSGIGPDIVIKLMQHKLSIPIIIIADRTLLMERAKTLGLEVTDNVTIQHFH